MKKVIVSLFLSLFIVVPWVIADDPVNGPMPGEMVIPMPNLDRPAVDGPDLSYLAPPAPMAASQEIIDLLEQVDVNLLMSYLQDLVDFGPRVTGNAACVAAEEYIFNEFASMGLDVSFRPWSNSGYNGRNVEATIHGTGGINDPIYIVCGHMDSVSGSPGADDNGSGSAATLALAHLLSNYSFESTIRFVTFSGEEQGLLGSNRYASWCKSNGDNIVGVLNMDMTGFATSAYDMTHIKVYHDTASNWLLTYTDNVAQTYHDTIDLTVVPSGYTWGSDHSSFWDVGYNALFYHEYNFNDYYHSPQDIIFNMNLPYYVKCTQLTFATLLELAGPFEPAVLKPDAATLSARHGGTINFSLNAGADHGGRNYVLLATSSGTAPGTPLPGGLATLPLNWDGLTDMVWLNLNTPVFTDFLGVLDVDGLATAQLNAPGQLPLSLVGLVMHFAFASNNPWDFVSNPVSIKFVD
jgi:hypothetical protein